MARTPRRDDKYPYSAGSKRTREPPSPGTVKSNSVVRNNCGTKSTHSHSQSLALAMQLATPLTAKRLSKTLLCYHDFLVFESTLTVGPKNDLEFVPFTCGKKWCPSCTKRWSEQLTEKLLSAVASVPVRELRHLVLTIQNAEFGELKQRIHQLQTSFREWRNRGRRAKYGDPYWKTVIGYAAKMEIDVTPRGGKWIQSKRDGKPHKKPEGWHPHYHILIHCPSGFDWRRNSNAQRQWQLATKCAGAESSIGWITKPASRGIVREIAKYASKPLQLERLCAEDLIEVCEATHKRRLHTSNGTLKVKLKDETSGDFAFLDLLSNVFHNQSHPGETGRQAQEVINAFVRAFDGNAQVINALPALQQLFTGADEP